MGQSYSTLPNIGDQKGFLSTEWSFVLKRLRSTPAPGKLNAGFEFQISRVIQTKAAGSKWRQRGEGAHVLFQVFQGVHGVV